MKKKEFKDFGAILEMFDLVNDDEHFLYDLCRGIWEKEYYWPPSGFADSSEKSVAAIDFFESMVKEKLDPQTKEKWDQYWRDFTRGLTAVVFGVGFVTGNMYDIIDDPKALEEVRHLNKRIQKYVTLHPYMPKKKKVA